MAQDCFLTFGICRQIIMMQPGKLSILPLESKQWGKNANSVVVWPISFTNTDYTATALKHSDHGGGIPNMIGIDKNKITIELESMSYANGIGTQNTYNSNGVHVIAVGK